MMNDTYDFSCTGRPGRFLGLVGGFLFLILLESAVVVLFIIGLVSSPTLERVLLAGYALLLLVLFIGILFAPLRTRHRLTPEILEVRYGRDRILVPRSTIAGAEAVHVPLGTLQPLRASIDGRRGRVVAAFSEEGQVLLRLDGLYRFPVSGASDPVRELLINVDERERFLEMLAAGSDSQAPAPPESAREGAGWWLPARRAGAGAT